MPKLYIIRQIQYNDHMNEEEKQPNEFNELVETLHVALPTENLSLTNKIIAFLTSAGGLSIIAGILADIVRPDISALHYLFRILMGVAMIFVGYGIIKRKGWVVWLYGAITLIGLSINIVAAIIPLCITIYLYTQKIYFDTGIPKKLFISLKKFLEL